MVKPFVLGEAHHLVRWSPGVGGAGAAPAGERTLEADLVLAVISGRNTAPAPEYPVGELAEIVTLVRPTPVHDLRTTAHPSVPSTRPPHRDDDLRFRLHHFSQWLAYEYTETEPATIT